jgi:glycosyltransferase involved in cell wall biosynthesis
MLITPWIVTWRARHFRPAAWHLHDANLIPAGLVLRLLGRRVVWDGHETLRDQVRERTWIPRLLRRVAATLVGRLERLAVRVFSASIFGEPAAAVGSRFTVIRNFPDLDDEGPPPSRDDYVARDPIALYMGDITHTRGAIEMVRAMARLPIDQGARLDLVGRINIPGLEDQLRALDGWARVDLTGWIEYAELTSHKARARLGLALLHPTRQYVNSVPTKLFEYMAVGLPLIASDFEAWRPYVMPFECGILVDPRDVDQIADAIASILSQPEESWAMGSRGRKAVEERFNWSSEGARLVALYDRLLGTQGTTAKGT